MTTYRVYYDIEEDTKHGRAITKENESMCCDVIGKDLTQNEILRRLTNNLKTWASAGNKCGVFKKARFIIKYFEEKK